MANESVKMIVVMTATAVITGGLLAGFFGKVAPLIEKNRIEEEKRAIFTVLDKAKNYKIIDKEVQNGAKKELVRIFEGVDEGGGIVGYAFLAEGPGFAGPIRMMIGLSVDKKTMTGLKVTEQAETPGLGNKIVEDKFTGQFKGLALEPKVEYLKNKKPEKPNQIQAITGATISSKAVTEAINKKVAVVVELLKDEAGKAGGADGGAK